MKGKSYKLAQQFVIDTFTKAGKEGSIKHFERTVHWMKILKPKADEALLIAAISHDIERGFKKDAFNNIKTLDKGFQNEKYLKQHQNESSRIIGKYLKEIGAEESLITRVKYLVAYHEIGGDTDQNSLKDADSISFLENNAEHFIRTMIKTAGKDNVQGKIDWMFNRITSEEAKKICKPWYEKAIEILEE